MSAKDLNLVWYSSRARREASTAARLVLAAMADLERGAGVFCSVAHLSTMTGLHRRSVQRSLKELLKLGEIAIAKGDRKGGRGRDETVTYVIAIQNCDEPVAVSEINPETATTVADTPTGATKTPTAVTETASPTPPESVSSTRKDYPESSVSRARAREDDEVRLAKQLAEAKAQFATKADAIEATVMEAVASGCHPFDARIKLRRVIETKPRAAQVARDLRAAFKLAEPASVVH